MREILPSVFHWTASHEPFAARVSSYSIEPAGVVLDPTVPDEGLDALPGRPRQVVLSNGQHDRDAQRFADAFGIPIRASRPAAERLGASLEAQTFDDHDEVGPGLPAIHIGKLSPDEGAFHVAVAVAEGAIAFADGLIRYGAALGFVPDEALGAHPDRVREGLKDSLRGLLTRDFDHLEGHPVPKLPRVDVATGSLGQGLPIGVGLALAGRRLDRLPYRVWVLCGDSEMAEGSMWEAFEHAGFERLDNLTAIVDVNRLGQRGETMHGWDLDAYSARAHMRAGAWRAAVG
jgi:hypothetical protein